MKEAGLFETGFFCNRGDRAWFAVVAGSAYMEADAVAT
jgi:hypothetical protein